MYYFFMKKNFNLQQYDFEVTISPRLTKHEQDILNIFLDSTEVNKEYTEIQYDFNLFKVSYFNLIEVINSIKKNLSVLK